MSILFPSLARMGHLNVVDFRSSRPLNFPDGTFVDQVETEDMRATMTNQAMVFRPSLLQFLVEEVLFTHVPFGDILIDPQTEGYKMDRPVPPWIISASFSHFHLSFEHLLLPSKVIDFLFVTFVFHLFEYFYFSIVCDKRKISIPLHSLRHFQRKNEFHSFIDTLRRISNSLTLKQQSFWRYVEKKLESFLYLNHLIVESSCDFGKSIVTLFISLLFRRRRMRQ